MNKFLIFLLSLGLLLSVNSVYADDPTGCASSTDSTNSPAIDCVNYCQSAHLKTCDMPEGSVCYCNPLSGDGLESITDPIINFIFKISIVVVPVLVTYGAFMIITAAGDTAKVDQAKKFCDTVITQPEFDKYDNLNKYSEDIEHVG